MQKKQIFIGFTLIALVVGFIFFQRSKSPSSPQEKAKVAIVVTPTPEPVNLLTWTDEAGFSFQYPEGTDIDKHPEDKVNYANLTLTLPSKDIVGIKMSDNTYKDLVEWAGQASTIDTTLEGRPAKKILQGDLETLACIDNEVIVTITGKDLSTITKSWTFIYPTPTATSKSNSAPVVEENVLEEE